MCYSLAALDPRLSIKGLGKLFAKDVLPPEFEWNCLIENSDVFDIIFRLHGSISHCGIGAWLLPMCMKLTLMTDIGAW